MSQDAKKLLTSDITFQNDLQNAQYDTVNNISNSMSTITSSYVLEIRQLMNILEGQKELLNDFDNGFRIIRDKYISLAISNHEVNANDTIQTGYTGHCVKRRDPRKKY